MVWEVFDKEHEDYHLLSKCLDASLAICFLSAGILFFLFVADSTKLLEVAGCGILFCIGLFLMYDTIFSESSEIEFGWHPEGSILLVPLAVLLLIICKLFIVIFDREI